jgi:phosphoribosyl-ATP pyrophosphohydrolase/phosphoribosyl-AMP cyclohydrolase
MLQAAVAAAAAGGSRVTAAGGITTADDIAWLDRMGADAQVGMALYTGRLTLPDAMMAPLKDTADGLWPTVVCDEGGRALGLAWSNPESLRRAVAERRGIYWSRSRREVWVKGATSGNGQSLVRVDLDCDRDTVRFLVRQGGTGFCHQGTRSCWGTDFDLDALERTIAGRRGAPAGSSNTARLLAQPELLAAKLREEAAELAAARSPEEAVEEAADVLFFTLAALAARGVSLEDVRRTLERRSLRVTRRPMQEKD